MGVGQGTGGGRQQRGDTHRHDQQRAPQVQEASASARQDAVARQLLRLGQAKLVVGGAEDAAEHEADRVADHVVAALDGGGTPGLRTTPSAAGPAVVQRKAAPGAEGGALDTATEGVLRQARSGGTALSATVRAPMEQAFGADFGQVRVHVGAAAADLNRQLQSRAFTFGKDIFFGQGERPDASPAGQALLAHELTHTVQQGAVTQSEPTVRRLMDPKKFKKKSGGLLSGKRDRIKAVETALAAAHASTNKAAGCGALVKACDEYLAGTDKIDKARRAGVEALRAQALAEWAQYLLIPTAPLPAAVYRMDERKPSEIAKVGFQPWMPAGDITVIEHVRQVLEHDVPDGPNGDSGAKGMGAKKHSQFVSTAGEVGFVRDPTLLAGLPGKYLYKITTTTSPDTFTDVQTHFDRAGVKNPYETQFEWAKTGGISGAEVTHFIHGKDLIPFVLDPTMDASTIAWKPMPPVKPPAKKTGPPVPLKPGQTGPLPARIGSRSESDSESDSDSDSDSDVGTRSRSGSGV